MSSKVEKDCNNKKEKDSLEERPEKSNASKRSVPGRLFLNYNVKELILPDNALFERNLSQLNNFKNYQTSYREVTRFLFGSWLLFPEEMPHPFNPKGIIIINTDRKITDISEHKGIELVLCNDIQSCLDSYYFHVYKEDLIIMDTNGDLLVLQDNFKFPKYSAKLDAKQVKMKKTIEKRVFSAIR